MKILNVVPVNSDVYTPEIDNYVRMYLGEDTVLDTVSIHNGSPSIECEFDVIPVLLLHVNVWTFLCSEALNPQC